MDYPFIPYQPPRFDVQQMLAKARQTYRSFDARRSVRHFSDEPVPRELIELAIQAASTAPSGAHLQPWKFVAVSDPELKRSIRMAAENEERESYEGGRMPPAWIEALRPLGTDWHKEYLEIVPWIVVVFEQTYRSTSAGTSAKNYYVKESVGIACGMFIVALHEMGLVTLTHTPSPMGFLSKILGRPENERPFILFPIGYPAADAQVPDIKRRSLDEVSEWLT